MPAEDVLLALQRIEGSGPVGHPDEQLGAHLLRTSRLLINHLGINGEPARIDLHPADVVPVDLEDCGPDIGAAASPIDVTSILARCCWYQSLGSWVTLVRLA
jgi:hypothetical protein